MIAVKAELLRSGLSNNSVLKLSHYGFSIIVDVFDLSALSESQIIKNAWLLRDKDTVYIAKPLFEEMEGLNPHPHIKNPELILLTNLIVGATMLRSFAFTEYDVELSEIVYGSFNFIYDESGEFNQIETLCSYYAELPAEEETEEEDKKDNE